MYVCIHTPSTAMVANGFNPLTRSTRFIQITHSLMCTSVNIILLLVRQCCTIISSPYVYIILDSRLPD